MYKAPPQDIETEEVVLGALMLGGSVEDIPFLQPEVFYKPAHGIVFSAIKSLYAENKPIDIRTVSQKVRADKSLADYDFGPLEISQLTNKIASADHLEEHAKILYEKYIRRSVIQVSSELIKKSYDDSEDVFEIQSKATKDLDTLVEFKGISVPEGLDNLNSEMENRNTKLLENKGLSGVTSGLSEMDLVTGGWQKTDLIIVAARPGMGKTSLALKFAIESARSGEPVLFFSLEMSRQQLYYRISSIETGIPLEKYFRKGLNPAEMDQHKTWFETAKKWPIIIDDTSALSISDMRLKCKRFKKKNKGKSCLIITDYIQLHTITGFKNGNRTEEVGKISSGLKQIAKETDTPIIALSQLSRNVENRGGDKRPQLSDLRDSGSIEQDADMVVFIYRPEYYGITEDSSGNSTSGKALLDIAKHRNGALTDVVVNFDTQYTRFKNIDYGESNNNGEF